MDDVGCEYHIFGQVQGVGYRYFVQRTAKELNLCGWVKNMPDGSVMVRAYGTAKAMADFREKLKEGPRACHVAEIDARPIEAIVASALQPFQVTY